MSRDHRGKKNPRWRPVMDRFWEKVKKTDSCWNWAAATNAGGYGIFKVDGNVLLAHRFIMDATEDICVLHHCDNPQCVNPDHLYFGDRKQNAYDRDSRGKNGYQKLSDKDIIAIYRSNKTNKQLCRQYTINHAVVSRIKNGKSYVWLTQQANDRWIDKGHS